MSETNDSLTKEKELLESVEYAPASEKIKTYTKLSGPGWLQGAITLGGGSLGGSLYLGIIGGTELLWLQPLMMILGVLMLSVIGYVTLSTGKKPFQAINDHINPVLGWGWLVAAMLANLVWAMPQFSLGTAALQQNLGVLPEGDSGKYLGAALLFIVGTVVVLMYDSKWAKYFEVILKLMVGIVVLSFFGVVAVMANQLDWSAILKGFLPNFSMFVQPASELRAVVEESSEQDYWNHLILDQQRFKMVTAAATAVGINMTFLLPYSMLRKGWGKEHRGLATFDLGFGLFIPFFLATTCVMIAAASQFHGKYNEGLIDPSSRVEVPSKIQKGYDGNMAKFQAHLETNTKPDEEAKKPNLADKKLAAMLVNRDAFQLADSLENLTNNKNVSQTVFGIGVLGMAVSTIIILMLINGFCLSEALGSGLSGPVHKLGSILPGITGALGFLFIWGTEKAGFLLVVPTSVFGMVLLPIAYFTFFFMINNKELLGDSLPKGGKRVALNLAIGLALFASTIGAGWAIWAKAGPKGFVAVGIFLMLALGGHCYRKLNQKLDRIDSKLEK